MWNYTEPFFAIPFLTGYGGVGVRGNGELLSDPDPAMPALDTPESVAAYRFILSLRDEARIVPRNCDYETADSLFKTGQAAMIINGDWSWADYLDDRGIDAAVAPLPMVSSTGPADAADGVAQRLFAQCERRCKPRSGRWSLSTS